jgi:hypothetical protein
MRYIVLWALLLNIMAYDVQGYGMIDSCVAQVCCNKKMCLLVALGVATSIFLLFYPTALRAVQASSSNKKEKCEEQQKDIEKIEHTVMNKVQNDRNIGLSLEQLPVVQQSGALCGYHALVQGLLVISCLIRKTTKDEMLATLINVHVVQPYIKTLMDDIENKRNGHLIDYNKKLAEFERDGNVYALNNYKKFPPKEGNQWINDGEIRYLFDNHSCKIVGQGSDAPTFMYRLSPIPDIPVLNKTNKVQVGSEWIDVPASSTPQSVHDIFTEGIKQKQERCILFAMGTMSQNENHISNNGHWWTLIVHQNSEGIRTGYCMDSLSSVNRRNDAQQMMQYVEQWVAK